MLKRKSDRDKSNDLAWKRYKSQRNLVTKLKKASIKCYFDNKCNENSNYSSKEFWNVVKPFFKNVKPQDRSVSLLENSSLQTDPVTVAETFNKYFVNVADDLGESADLQHLDLSEVNNLYKDHVSVTTINETVNISEPFVFHHVTPEQVKKTLNNLKTNKACGYDNIPAKLLKMGSQTLSYTLTPIINMCIDTNRFPNDLKCAEVTPIHKSKDILDKCNFRPVSVLTALSKVFESCICDQLSCYLNGLLSNMLAAYRKQYSCNNVLIKCIEEWKSFLDNKEYVGCLLMDLSKAFDCLPHALLLSKLNAYGLHIDACQLIKSYLSGRLQRVRINDKCSSWLMLKRGIPQGSLLGPFLFNVFLNDLLIYLANVCSVYNYADDNSLSCHDPKLQNVIFNLEAAAEKALTWFDLNHMKANPNKFNLIVFSGRNQYEEVTMRLRNIEIKSMSEVKLLGITLDKNLNFKSHINNLCKKAARQVNAMSRLSHVLSTTTKMSVFNSFVKSNFAYCTVTFHYCGVQSDKKLEKIYERALRTVYNDFTSMYQNVLKRANKKMLYEEREDIVVETVYKIINNMVPPLDNSMFTSQITMYNLRNSNMLNVPSYQTVTFGFNSIRVNGAIRWNKLPMQIKNCDNLRCFKNALQKYRYQCNCGSCIKCFFYASR